MRGTHSRFAHPGSLAAALPRFFARALAPPIWRVLLQVTLGAAPNVADMREKGLQNRPFGAKSATNTPKSRENDQQEAAES